MTNRVKTQLELLQKIGDQFRSGFYPRAGHSQQWEQLQQMGMRANEVEEIGHFIETTIALQTAKLHGQEGQDEPLETLREAVPTFCRMYSCTHALQIWYIETPPHKNYDHRSNGNTREAIRRCLAASSNSIDLLGTIGITLPMIRECLILANRIGVDPATEWCANRVTAPPFSLASSLPPDPTNG